MAKTGAATKYNKKYCEELMEYFSVAPYEQVEKNIFTKKGEIIQVTEDRANDVPSFAGFCCKIQVCKQTLLNWRKEHPEFRKAYSLAKAYQENFMIVNGNRGLIDKTFGIFTAKNLMGWRDKQPDEEEIKVTNEIKINYEDISERIKQIKEKK